MGRPSKGSRSNLTVRVPDQVADVLEERRQAAGVSSLSQYIADVLASAAGRPDLVRELAPNQEVLPLGA